MVGMRHKLSLPGLGMSKCTDPSGAAVGRSDRGGVSRYGINFVVSCGNPRNCTASWLSTYPLSCALFACRARELLCVNSASC